MATQTESAFIQSPNYYRINGVSTTCSATFGSGRSIVVVTTLRTRPLRTIWKIRCYGSPTMWRALVAVVRSRMNGSPPDQLTAATLLTSQTRHGMESGFAWLAHNRQGLCFKGLFDSSLKDAN